MTETGNEFSAGNASSEARGETTVRQASGPDAAVIEALRRGDEDAFTRLVQQYQGALLRIARLYVSSPAIADDVVQDTWLAVVRGIWAFEGRSSLRTWILRILINQSKTRAVREGRTVPLSDAGLADPAAPEHFGGPPHQDDDGEAHDLRPDQREAGGGPALHDPVLSPEVGLLTEEARVQIRAAIDALPVNQRIVITMRDLEGCSSEEVCNALGLSETNQRVILHRARSHVRTRLTALLRER